MRSETKGISEATSTNGRGRPRLWREEFLKTLASVYSSKAQTRRQKQNIVYAHQALQVLLEDSPGFPADGPYAWLICDKPAVMKTSVLAELGRLDDAGDILALARSVCKERMTAKRAVAVIRRARGALSRGGGVAGLYRQLARTVLDYVGAHPQIKLADVCRVLDQLRAAYVEVEAAEPKAEAKGKRRGKK